MATKSASTGSWHESTRMSRKVFEGIQDEATRDPGSTATTAGQAIQVYRLQTEVRADRPGLEGLRREMGMLKRCNNCRAGNTSVYAG